MYIMILMIMVLSGCASSNVASDATKAIQPSESANNQETESVATDLPEQLPETSSEATPPVQTELARLIEQGYQVEKEHVFTQQFEEIGELTVTPLTRYGLEEEFPVVLVLRGEDKQIVLTPERGDSHPMFSSFEAIAFKDIDPESLKSGYTDIVVIANFITGVGQDGVNPFSDVFIFKNDSWGGFVEDLVLEERVLDAITDRTITMKQVYSLVKPVDVESFVGNFINADSTKYDESTIVIHQIKGDRVAFTLDAFHVNGDDKGIENGNVNIGNIDQGVAILTSNQAVYKAEGFDFTLTFTFFSNDTFRVSTTGDGYFGHNVYVDGLFKRSK
ncbi:MAG: hypothetical protein P0Y55_10455 [Candidatus Cohnella colombiensis]|uniref:Lipoprotein n=1 Tax=Candidatus Cohnella colombiensis TaxID=3121368 RepID=A0AA95J997_9BACL|nr:MAG: hypothetical protein P0Y55_10455 [Cohnella sp.]